MITREEVDTILAELPCNLEETVQNYINQLENEIYHPKQPKTKTVYIYHYYAKAQEGATFDGLYTSDEKIDNPNAILTLKRLIVKEANKDGFSIKYPENLALCSLTFLHTVEEPC